MNVIMHCLKIKMEIIAAATTTQPANEERQKKHDTNFYRSIGMVDIQKAEAEAQSKTTQ